MTPITLSDYLTGALLAPLQIPGMLILVTQWRISKKAIKRLAVIIYLFMLCLSLGAVWAFGLTLFARNLVLYTSTAVCWGAFMLCCRFRDGRLPFTIFTQLVLITVDELFVYTVLPPRTMASVVLRVVLVVVQSLFLYYVCRKPYHKMLNSVDTGWLRMTTVPLSLFICLCFSYARPLITRRTPENLEISWALAFCALMFYVNLYYFLSAVEEKGRAEQGYALLSTQMHLLEDQTKRLTASMDADRAFRHDIRHFLNLMRASATVADPAAMDEVLHSMEMSVQDIADSYSLTRYTGNTIIDMALSLAAERAAAEGIGFSVQMFLPDDFAVDSTELAVVISNALENAITACLAMPPGAPRQIKVFNTPGQKQYYLSVQNTYAGKVEFDPHTGLPVSRHAGHGYGTQSIAVFARKHGALLQYSAKDGWFRLGLLI